jgi:exonuclease III
MPYYQEINPLVPAGKRTLENLISLRAHLSREIPPKDLEDKLLLATWNIREFDSPSFGKRLPESFYYIAEILNRFDLIAIQEVRKDVKAMDTLVQILGPTWKYILNDVTEGNQGNNERTAFLFDTRKVSFAGLAGELVLPPVRKKDENGKTVYEPVSQVARTPFLVGFQAGWTTFLLTTVHILYGSSKANDPERVKEIHHVAHYLREHSEDETAWSKNLILLGDFNIFKNEDLTMKALTDEGFIIPPELQNLPSNVQMNKHYDQIAFRVREDRFGTTGKAGVFNFFETIYREEDEQAYIPEMGNAYFQNSRGKARSDRSKSTYYNTYWRTHQLSDHLPMWVELKINYSDQYLNRKLGSASGGAFQDVLNPAQWSRSADHSLQRSSSQTSKLNFTGVDLQGKDLSRRNLSGTVFFETNLNLALLRDSDLQNADLRFSNLAAADLENANLKGANLRGANLFEANLTGANLEEADLTGTVLFGVIWDGANLNGARFRQKDRLFLEEAGIDVGTIVFQD